MGLEEEQSLTVQGRSNMVAGEFRPPMRRFRVLHAKSYRRPAPDGLQVSPLEEIIERESVWFGDSFLMFGNGGEYQVKTDVIVIAWEPGLRVEEIPPSVEGETQ